MFISLSFGHSGTRIHNISYYAINVPTCKKEKCRFRNTLFSYLRSILRPGLLFYLDYLV